MKDFSDFVYGAVFSVLTVLFLVAIVLMVRTAQADTIHDVLALETIPELGGKYVAVEGGAYYSAGVDSYRLVSGKDQGPVLTGGAAVGFRDFGLGASVVYDRDVRYAPGVNSNTSAAVGLQAPLSELVTVKFGFATDIKQLDRVTMGIKFRVAK